jgi:hypothetical protein
MRRACAIAVVSMTMLFGCAGADESDDDDVAEVAAVVESGDTRALATAMADSPSDIAGIAEHVARHALGALYPETCATRSVNVVDPARPGGASAHLELEDCTGPFGKRRLTGGIDFSFRLESGPKVVVDIHASAGLQANDRPLAYDATATFAPGSRTVHWEAHAVGTTARGRSFDKSSVLELAVEPLGACSTMNGTVTGTVAARGVDVSVSDYRVCGYACPASGTILKTRETKKATTRTKQISFDGTESATVTGPKGTRSVALVCGEDAK